MNDDITDEQLAWHYNIISFIWIFLSALVFVINRLFVTDDAVAVGMIILSSGFAAMAGYTSQKRRNLINKLEKRKLGR
jgi:hypothetical protein